MQILDGYSRLVLIRPWWCGTWERIKDWLWSWTAISIASLESHTINYVSSCSHVPLMDMLVYGHWLPNVTKHRSGWKVIIVRYVSCHSFGMFVLCGHRNRSAWDRYDEREALWISHFYSFVASLPKMWSSNMWRMFTDTHDPSVVRLWESSTGLQWLHEEFKKWRVRTTRRLSQRVSLCCLELSHWLRSTIYGKELFVRIITYSKNSWWPWEPIEQSK